MHPAALRSALRSAFPAAILAGAAFVSSQSPLQPEISRETDGDMTVRMPVPSGSLRRIEASSNLQQWQTLATITSNGTAEFRDSAAVYHRSRHYRFTEAPASGAFPGDHFPTTSGDAIIRPINHATFLIRWNNLTIYCDPVGATSLYTGLPKANVILITHSHSDHWSSTTTGNQRNPDGCAIFAPQAVHTAMSATLKALTTVMNNGATTTTSGGLGIEAIPAYNSNHPPGSGNGYILTLGGKRLYFSGDTGDIPETRALQNIDIAFLCMNIPYTMDVNAAVAVVRAFRPRTIYPYHYRNQNGSFADLRRFEDLVSTDLGIEVRSRPWY
jgi:L-ascorbate metabolism protein UlaG (beta-lactamase superfamily)